MVDANELASQLRKDLANKGFAAFQNGGREADRLLAIDVTDERVRIEIASDGLSLDDKELIERLAQESFARFDDMPPSRVNFKRQLPLGTSAPKNSGPFGLNLAPSAVANVSRIVAVASGKGGVGKSTVAVNLAISLAQQGLKVGIVDADIYGPSLPTLLGLDELPQLNSTGRLLPVERYNLATMTFGFFVQADDAVGWRGPLVAKALEQLFFKVAWPKLDVLVVDLPPGTGDVHLTLLERVKIDGVITVTTPQLLALADVRKGVGLFKRAQTPLLGIVENMTQFRCANCGETSGIFGEDLVTEYAREAKIPLLAQIPLHAGLRTASDQGCPVTLNPEHPVTAIFADLALTVTKQLKLSEEMCSESGQLSGLQ